MNRTLYTVLILAALSAAWPARVGWVAPTADEAALDGRLIVNGDFSRWEDERPSGWRWRETPPAVRLMPEEYLGSPVLRVESTNALFQQIDNPPVWRDDRLVLDLHLSTEEEDTVFVDIDLRYPEGPDERVLTREFHPGGGFWEHMRLELVVPRADPERVTIAIHIRDTMSRPVYVSNVRAHIVPATP